MPAGVRAYRRNSHHYASGKNPGRHRPAPAGQPQGFEKPLPGQSLEPSALATVDFTGCPHFEHTGISRSPAQAATDAPTDSAARHGVWPEQAAGRKSGTTANHATRGPAGGLHHHSSFQQVGIHGGLPAFCCTGQQRIRIRSDRGGRSLSRPDRSAAGGHRRSAVYPQPAKHGIR